MYMTAHVSFTAAEEKKDDVGLAGVVTRGKKNTALVHGEWC